MDTACAQAALRRGLSGAVRGGFVRARSSAAHAVRDAGHGAGKNAERRTQQISKRTRRTHGALRGMHADEAKMKGNNLVKQGAEKYRPKE
jgi:hypothetical protein